VSEGGGVDRWESAAYESLKDSVISDEGVHFVATHRQDGDQYRVDGMVDGSAQTLRFERQRLPGGGVDYVLLDGDFDDFFPRRTSQHFGTWEALLADGENPNGVQRMDVGYAADDPRVTFLPPDKQVYPIALERLAALFDAPDAPDAVLGLKPWAGGSAGGTHGGMSLLQSRAALMISGSGARRGVIIDEEAILADVAPTALAALGVPTTGGMGRYGLADDGLYLLRQDGRVLWEGLATDSCDRPKHVIVLLFDGLEAGILNHLVLSESPPVELPTFRGLADNGAVYRYGAVVGFPSVSAPGHTTAGTGVWAGRHGIVANAFYRRQTGETLNPFSLISDPVALVQNPGRMRVFYEAAISSDVETLAMAAHRALGPYDAQSGEGAFVAVINEIAIGGADYTTVDFLEGLNGGQKPSRDGVNKYSIADQLAVTQVVELLGDTAQPVPTILQLSMLAADAAGEAAGPHSDLNRSVLETLDGRVQEILAAYKDRGAWEDTLVIVTADHGMELQDPSRATGVGALIAESGIQLRQPAFGVFYFKTIEIVASIAESNVLVTVVDHDNQTPLPGATVVCNGCVEDTLLSGPAGEVGFTMTHPLEEVILSVSLDGYNPQSMPLQSILSGD